MRCFRQQGFAQMCVCKTPASVLHPFALPGHPGAQSRHGRARVRCDCFVQPATCLRMSICMPLQPGCEASSASFHRQREDPSSQCLLLQQCQRPALPIGRAQPVWQDGGTAGRGRHAGGAGAGGHVGCDRTAASMHPTCCACCATPTVPCATASAQVAQTHGGLPASRPCLPPILACLPPIPAPSQSSSCATKWSRTASLCGEQFAVVLGLRSTHSQQGTAAGQLGGLGG